MSNREEVAFHTDLAFLSSIPSYSTDKLNEVEEEKGSDGLHPQQPYLASMKSFVTGERSSKKKGQGASLGFHEDLGPSIALSLLLRVNMHLTTF